VEINDLSAVEHAIDGQTRVLFCETIANPKMNVADLSALSALARRRKLIFVVDGTVTTPVLCDAKRWGIDVMVHSTTKLISGGATSVGGVIVDMGSADWTAIPALGRYHSLKEWAFVARLRKEVYRDLGACLSPYHAYLQSLGLETLALRVNQACANALKIAQTLKADPRIKSVNYPGLPDSPYHELAKAQFNGQFGAILTLELADKPTAFQFLNRLTLIKRATNLGDNTTLAIHPASTIFVEYTKEDREAMGVSDGLVRLSVGIEDSADLLEDLRQALLG
jgi:O-acetylhomoserine (thiol)-lyase